MEQNNFYNDGTKNPFWSRDFQSFDIPCSIVKCPANNGYDKCIMPSCIKIGIDGRCEMFKKINENKKEKKKR